MGIQFNGIYNWIAVLISKCLGHIKFFVHSPQNLNTVNMKPLQSIKELKSVVLSSEEQKKVKGGTSIIVDIIGP